MEETAKIKWRCFWSAFIWVYINSIIALAPLISLILIQPIANDKKSIAEEIYILLRGGAVLFVCCALMGAVVIESILERIPFQTTFTRFLYNIAPFIFLCVVCALYLMTIGKMISPSIFTTVSVPYVMIVLITIVYCISGKYRLYLQREIIRDKIDAAIKLP